MRSNCAQEAKAFGRQRKRGRWTASRKPDRWAVFLSDASTEVGADPLSTSVEMLHKQNKCLILFAKRQFSRSCRDACVRPVNHVRPALLAVEKSVVLCVAARELQGTLTRSLLASSSCLPIHPGARKAVMTNAAHDCGFKYLFLPSALCRTDASLTQQLCAQGLPAVRTKLGIGPVETEKLVPLCVEGEDRKEVSNPFGRHEGLVAGEDGLRAATGSKKDRAKANGGRRCGQAPQGNRPERSWPSAGPMRSPV